MRMFFYYFKQVYIITILFLALHLNDQHYIYWVYHSSECSSMAVSQPCECSSMAVSQPCECFSSALSQPMRMFFHRSFKTHANVLPLQEETRGYKAIVMCTCNEYNVFFFIYVFSNYLLNETLQISIAHNILRVPFLFCHLYASSLSYRIYCINLWLSFLL